MSILDTITTWLLEPESRDLPAEPLVERLCGRLVEAGVPVAWASTSIHTLHPEVAVRNIRWRRTDGAQTFERPHTLLESNVYADSPIAPILDGEADTIRRCLAGPDAQLDFPICLDLAGEGATDYLAMLLRYGGGRRSFISWATDADGGFSEEHVHVLDAIRPLLALRLELESAYFSKRSLLEVYLGSNAAARVMDGVVRRGQGQVIRAAIWYCDLRGFTAMSDRLPPDRVVETLDRYFEAVSYPVVALGGDILKFIGDAMLAIFPVDDAGPDEAARLALRAAREAVDAMALLNAARTDADEPPLGIGVALHLGDVMYGNIGGRERLDFTVIGATVNEVCRVEPLCKPLGLPLLLTGTLAEHCADVVSLGHHELRGVGEPQEVFTVAELVES